MEPPSVSSSGFEGLEGFTALADGIAGEAATSTNEPQNCVPFEDFDGREREGSEVCHT
jgi:hypothetical protein